MNDREAIEMMRRAAGEIRDLRAHIDRLSPRAEAYEVIRTITGMVPRPSMGGSPDLAWQLDRRAAELEKEMMQPVVTDLEPTPAPEI